MHRVELSKTINESLADIDLLPLHPKNKILLYSRHLLSKISWHLTVADLSKTWVSENLDNIVASYIRKWLEVPISGTLSNVFLTRTKLGLNIYPPSIKYSQCQTVLRNILRKSPNDDIRSLWKTTSTHTNLQYDQYRDTKQVLKAFHTNQEERLQSHLISQGSFFANVMSNALLKLSLIWSLAQSNLPKNIFNFTVKYINNTLPHRKKLAKWGLSTTSDCSFSLMTESLLHIVAGCQFYHQQGRYTWRHDYVLQLIATTFQSVTNVTLYPDLPGFLSPSVRTGDNLRPGLLLSFQNKCLYMFELTVGFETTLQTNISRKNVKYRDLIRSLKQEYKDVRCINPSLSTLGVFSSLSSDFLDMLQDLNIDNNQRNFILRKITNIAIRCTYYIFCCRNKEWNKPELLNF